MDTPDTRARLDTIGAELSPMAQPQYVAFHEAENKRHAELIKKHGIKLV